jgi:SAM-dependent methyltransferase
VGAGAGEVSPVAAGAADIGPLNAANYRITDADRIGEGGLKQKYRQNVAAIRTLRRVQAESRPPTPEEKSVIAKYVGWGGLPQVFSTPDDAPQWRAEQEELAALLEPDEMSSARATVLNAHYTSPTVIRGMYAALDRLGFKHGRILEPACGLGHFFGLMPEAMAARSRLTGVEIDPLTARLAKALYPDADIRSQAFENVTLPTNGFDLAVSNVPFGDYAPFDPKLNPRKFQDPRLLLRRRGRTRAPRRIGRVHHVARDDRQTVSAPARGGRQVVRFCRRDPTAEHRVQEERQHRGHDRHRVSPEARARRKARWASRGGRVGRSAEANPIFLNEYFHAHPEMMLGKLERVEHGMYGREEVRLSADGRDLGEAIAVPSPLAGGCVQTADGSPGGGAAADHSRAGGR